MANETKKRLLLSKWSGSRSEVVKLRADNAALEKARDEAWRDVESMQNERNGLQSYIDDMESPGAFEVLEEVKYWLHDGLVLHKIVSDPRALLRKVEDVL